MMHSVQQLNQISSTTLFQHYQLFYKLFKLTVVSDKTQTTKTDLQASETFHPSKRDPEAFASTCNNACCRESKSRECVNGSGGRRGIPSLKRTGGQLELTSDNFYEDGQRRSNGPENWSSVTGDGLFAMTGGRAYITKQIRRHDCSRTNAGLKKGLDNVTPELHKWGLLLQTRTIDSPSRLQTVRILSYRKTSKQCHSQPWSGDVVNT